MSTSVGYDTDDIDKTLDNMYMPMSLWASSTAPNQFISKRSHPAELEE